MNERLNGWWKIAATFLPLLAAGLLAFQAVRSEVGSLRRDMERKADESVVQLQYETLLRELQAINRRLDRLEPR